MNAGHIKHMAQVRQLYGPNLGTLTDNLPSMGDSLHDACNALANDCTIKRIDELVSQLKTAQQTLTRLRLAAVEKWGTGIR
jgi:hypothetical protein